MCTNEPRPFAVGDLVILRQVKDPSAPAILTKPLKSGSRIESHRGVFEHADIIGKGPREVIQPKVNRSSGAGYRLHPVTLHDYVLRSRRIVTPIYPDDAGLVVSLLDLHPDVAQHGEDSDATLEILEAGTGHGALTLFLSRAIHAANPPRPAVKGDTEADHEEKLASWRSQRRAIIHTIEISPRVSTHARTTVSGFRHGMYADNVDFHVGDVSEWLAEKLPERGGQPFLSHAVLDMPSADTHLANVADALITNGTLVVFNPSVTQIGECARKVQDDGIPLELEKVIELGVNGGSGGREWDLRFVQPRARQAAKSKDRADVQQDGARLDAEAVPISDDEEGPRIRQSKNSEDSDVSQEEPNSQAHDDALNKDSRAIDDVRPANELNDEPNSDTTKLAMVCRPKVGGRIQGGGFLGVWKKQRRIRRF